jgi:hypothetical protein
MEAKALIYEGTFSYKHFSCIAQAENIAEQFAFKSFLESVYNPQTLSC